MYRNSTTYQENQVPKLDFWSNSYRYGFNGMEKDDEVKGSGNSYTTEFRQYDPRLGRWLSLDPLMAKYPDQSPYAAFNNNPIYFIDPNGLEGVNSTSGDPGKKADRQNKRFERLENRLSKKFAGNDDQYLFELAKRGSKARYGTIVGPESSSFKDEKAKGDQSITGGKYNNSFDNRKSEYQQAITLGATGLNSSPLGTAGDEGGTPQTVEFKNVKDGEVIYFEANTFGGFQVQIFIDDKLVETFDEAPQIVTKIPEDAQHFNVKEQRSVTINHGSNKPKTIVITVKTVFTEDGAKVHNAEYPFPAILSNVKMYRQFPYLKSK